MKLEFRQKDFWITENQNYKIPYFRLEKCSKIVNSLSKGQNCELLDIGCGPATLATLLNTNISYFGIDIAIHEPNQNFLEIDIVNQKIQFLDKKFDLIVAAGLFEYVGNFQHEKFQEIRNLLKENGKFITTYTNFNHIHQPALHPPYNNIMSIDEFKYSLSRLFRIEKYFPSSHNRILAEPIRKWNKRIQMLMNFEFPILSKLYAVNYFFICS